MNPEKFLIEFDLMINRYKSKRSKSFNYVDMAPLLYRPSIELKMRSGINLSDAMELIFYPKFDNGRIICGHLQPKGSY